MEFSDIPAWLSTGRDAVALLKAAGGLLPKGEKKAEIEGKIEDAEVALRKSNALLAKDLGFPLCQCTFPSSIMLWKEAQKAHVCPNLECGHIKPRGMQISREAVVQAHSRSGGGWMAR
ncbi:hypothetical protein HN018_13115 [Lichenicola cladoniae]|uniref:Uncharacterized protein n=1 Tax=Lichenicola cladoniae TaxID=1484109 RepID=A0A6M8HRK9_9PROT|nr:hypothetical protein [Lichenicola cladoniae]NPD68714.1 hypothetical protein [Acetobacteraceae bacterium]QKE90851.1 hypothetical protein HN018_13115 [Lichenicola cladoniae]